MTRQDDHDDILRLLPFVEELASAMRSKDESLESRIIGEISRQELLKQDYVPGQASKDLLRLGRLRSWQKIFSVFTYCIRAKRWIYEYSPEKWSDDYIGHIEAILLWMKKELTSEGLL